MPRNRAPKGKDIRSIQPTIVLLNADLAFNGGTLSNAEVAKVLVAVKDAFGKAAHAAGLGFSWSASLRCVKPEVMRKRIEREDLNVEIPPAVAAVDHPRYNPCSCGFSALINMMHGHD